VFAGIFGTILLCAALYTADWYFRRHKIGHLHENYGLEKGTFGRSEVRGFGPLSETQAVGYFVGERVRGLHDGVVREKGRRRGEGTSGESEDTTDSDEGSLTSSTQSGERIRKPRRLQLPSAPARAHRSMKRAITIDDSPDGIEQIRPQEAKLVPHYVAANMNWAYQKGYGDAARWLDIERQQRGADRGHWDQPRDAGSWYWNENGRNGRDKEWEDYEYGKGQNGTGFRKPYEARPDRATYARQDDYRRERMKKSGGRVPLRSAWLKDYGGGRVLGEI
jgi:hypothetical protein